MNCTVCGKDKVWGHTVEDSRACRSVRAKRARDRRPKRPKTYRWLQVQTDRRGPKLMLESTWKQLMGGKKGLEVQQARGSGHRWTPAEARAASAKRKRWRWSGRRLGYPAKFKAPIDRIALRQRYQNTPDQGYSCVVDTSPWPFDLTRWYVTGPYGTRPTTETTALGHLGHLPRYDRKRHTVGLPVKWEWVPGPYTKHPRKAPAPTVTFTRR